MRDRLGMKEESARAFLEAELQKRVSTSSFYFENEETEDLLELVLDLMAALIDENSRETQRSLARQLQ
jgi:hypothetical protein